VPQHRLVCGETKVPKSGRLGSPLGRQQCVCFRLSGNMQMAAIHVTPWRSGWEKNSGYLFNKMIPLIKLKCVLMELAQTTPLAVKIFRHATS